MKELLIVVAVFASGLVLAGGAVFGLHDRQTFVPPPEAVAESFARQLVQRRYDLAVNYLGRNLRATTDANGLRARFDPLRQRIGTPNQVSGERDWMQESDASARALVEGESGNAVLQVRLEREQGLWRITQLPANVGAEAPALRTSPSIVGAGLSRPMGRLKAAPTSADDRVPISLAP